MALLFWDSFDHYATGDTLEKWTSADVGFFCSYAIGAYGRHGTNGIRIYRVSSRTCLVRKDLPATYGTLVAGVSVECAATLPAGYQSMLQFLDSDSVQVQLRVNNDGSVEVLRNGATSIGISSAGIMGHPDVAYYVEMKALISNAGSVEVKVNGVTVISESPVDTQHTANAWADQVDIGGYQSHPGNAAAYFDDFYLCDTSGAQCNDFLGDIRELLLMPDGAGAHADWTPLVGANWQEVDDNPPDGDTTYNASNTVTDRDSFTFEDLPGTLTGTILALCAAINSRRDDAVAHELEPSVRVGGTDYDGTAALVTDAYSFYNLYAWELNPDIAAVWTIATVNAVESGYELTV